MDFKNKSKSNILKNIKKSGVKRLVFYNQGVEKWEEIFEFFKNTDIEIGLGIWLSEKNFIIEKN